MIDRGLFDDLYNVGGGDDPDPNAPRQRICWRCSVQVLIYGMREWWIRERRFVIGGGGVLSMDERKDCVDGEHCGRQGDISEWFFCCGILNSFLWFLF